MFKKIITLKILLLLSFGAVKAQVEKALWLRDPAISPDGKTIVFSYKGDLYKVPSSGGNATLLTIHEAYDGMPVWSKDGKNIAFASDRYGNIDIFLISANGGNSKRLTYYSGNDFPRDFSKDNQQVIFNATRLDDPNHRQFPRRNFSELYQVSVKGGRTKQILTSTLENVRYNKDNSMMVFEEVTGIENDLRKHHTSSVARDIWTYDIKNKNFKQITNFKGEDRNPVFAPNGQSIFYLSEKTGSLNVYQTDLSGTNNPKKITNFSKHPVRHLSIADNGTLCFTYDGEIYTQNSSGKAQKVKVFVNSEDRFNKKQISVLRSGADEIAVSPNGKEVAFVIRGEVFITSVETNRTKRITNTPQRERSISFSPDGRAILYASERKASWDIYQTKLVRKEEKYFFNSTILEEEIILASKPETFQPSYSPDGKEVAFLESRTALKVINLKSKKVREIVSADNNYSYSDGDQYYEWSPDSKWFLVDFLPEKKWIGEVGLISASGDGKIINLTQSGYSEGGGSWAMGGKMMVYYSDRKGMRSHASWGSQGDVYGMFFTQEAYDQFKLSKEQLAIAMEQEKEAKKDEDKKDKKEDKKKTDKALEIELEGIQNRKVRLTIHSSRLGGFVLSKDGGKLYYLASFEGGFDLWETNLRTKQTKILAKLKKRFGSIILSKDGKYIFLLSSTGITRISLSNGSRKPIFYVAEMELDTNAERTYLFEHMWRQVKRKFYVKDIHGVDWDFYKKAYQKFLPHINNNKDFADLASELLGELNASHTGCYYRGGNVRNPDYTASLGVFYDKGHDGKGLKILEIMKGSPLLSKKSNIKAGTIIEKINGQEILKEDNYYKFLNRQVGKKMLLSLYNPKTKTRWEQVVTPISLGQEYQLRYNRWVENNEKLVKKLSNDRLGYVHVRGMNEESFRVVYEKALGKYVNKEALIVDTRCNGGGWLHDDLATFLSGKKYMEFYPRGQSLGPEPQFKWTKPSIVLMNETNYSDAHMFPYTYKALGIGKLLGMPVPGTGTAVWWENLPGGLVFGIPQVGMKTNDGKYMENTQLEPDIKVKNTFKTMAEGRDLQIERAVKELLK